MFLFTHIEKCAGTSFNEILSLTFPRYFHVTKNRFGGNDAQNDLTYEQFKKLKRFYPSGIGGHSIRPYLEFLPLPKRITFLRSPLERYLSHYNHLVERGYTTSIDDFLDNESFNNFMTKKIAGKDDYNYAEQLLMQFVFIGDANEYSKSLNYLQDVLNVKLIGNLEHKNQRKSDSNYLGLSDLSPNQLIRLEENNQSDLRLYEKFILQNSTIKSYSEIANLKRPSELRAKIIRRVDKYKKIKIINSVR